MPSEIVTRVGLMVPPSVKCEEPRLDAYLEAVPVSARRRSPRVLQQDAWDLQGAAVGVQRSFAERVDAYIERKVAEERAGSGSAAIGSPRKMR